MQTGFYVRVLREKPPETMPRMAQQAYKAGYQNLDISELTDDELGTFFTQLDSNGRKKWAIGLAKFLRKLPELA